MDCNKLSLDDDTAYRVSGVKNNKRCTTIVEQFFVLHGVIHDVNYFCSGAKCGDLNKYCNS
jgi:hypothetical protein